MQKFRASFSVLTMWSSGRYEDAVAAYFKLDSFTTPQMELGKELHLEWENEVKATGCMPKVFGGKALKDPKTERKIVKEIEPWLDLVGVVDLLDSPRVIDYKSGVTSAAQYANSPQGGIYALLATLDGVYVDRVEIHRYNPYNKKVDMAIRWVTDKMLGETLEYVKTTSADMHSYLTKNDLYTKLGKEVNKV